MGNKLFSKFNNFNSSKFYPLKKAKSKKDQIDLFWSQGDFGYVKDKRAELKTYCKATEPGGSSLQCVDHTRMCRGKNLYFDFSNLNIEQSHDRYREEYET